MKKILTLSLFVFALLVGTQNAFSQDKEKINEEASVKTEELQKSLRLSDSSKDAVYEVYLDYFQRKYRLAKSSNSNKANYSKLERFLDYKLKQVLTEEQFQQYKSLSKN